MIDPYTLLCEHFEKLERLEHALTFLQWDHMVMMPPGGSESRSKAIAELTKIYHDHLASEKTGELLSRADKKDLNTEQQRSLLEMERVYHRAICLPPDLVKAQALAGSKCEHGWRSQRQENDWLGFKENFKPVVQLSREEAQARYEQYPDRFLTRYDAMVDLYCTGDSSTFIGKVFATLKKELPPLLEKVLEKQKRSNYPHLTGPFDIPSQKELSQELMRGLGFDFDCGRIDVSAHPFSTGCRGDHRITTRFRESDFLEALLATAHETGHAAYEAGRPEKWDCLPIGSARNLCLHESQSLLFEKQIFLAKPFLNFFTGAIHTHLPSTKNLNSEMLWQTATWVERSLIRVEADEVTYPLHVILRFEIENDLINGAIEVDDIPDLWHTKMLQYLDIPTEKNYKDGCMQDMHWTDGAFGYFPSYTIGAINSSQLIASIRKDFPDWGQRLASGEIDFITQWLSEKIWSKGSSMESQEIMKTATGKSTDPRFLLEHLQQRYLEEQF